MMLMWRDNRQSKKKRNFAMIFSDLGKLLAGYAAVIGGEQRLACSRALFRCEGDLARLVYLLCAGPLCRLVRCASRWT